MAKAAFCDRCKRAKNARGITLVELIVVLVIMSILAAAGVGSAIGFVKRSRLTQNEDNANTIYQAVQTALLQMDKAGTIDSWVKPLVNNNIAEPLEASNDPNDPFKHFYEIYVTNQNSSDKKDDYVPFIKSMFVNDSKAKAISSKHMRYYLTYSPKSNSVQSDTLKELIQPYFYDEVIFGGTITIELDVEKAFDARIEPHYSARCLSVFVCSQEDDGWDNGGIPNRSLSERTKKNIGYYDGYAGYTVDTVSLPKIEDGLDIESFTYDKSTGCLTWVVTLEGKPVTGRGKHLNYQIDLYQGSTHNRRIILNEDFLTNGVQLINSEKVDFFSLLKNADDGEKIKIGDKSYKVSVIPQQVFYVDKNESTTVLRKSINIDAYAYTNTGLTGKYSDLSSESVVNTSMKLTITYVCGELGKDPYIEYSLHIGEYSTANNKATLIACPNDFSSSDLTGFNDKNGIVPMNKAEEVTVEPYIAPTATPEVTPEGN